MARAFGKTADEINRANQAGQNFNPKSLQIAPPTADGDKVILNLEEQNELLKIQDERQRAVAKARMAASKVTDNPNQIASAERLAAENYDHRKLRRHDAKRSSRMNSRAKAQPLRWRPTPRKLLIISSARNCCRGNTGFVTRTGHAKG